MIDARAILRRSGDVTLEISGAGEVSVRTGLGTAVLSPHSLVLLGEFLTPRRVGDVVGDVAARLKSAQAVADIAADLSAMVEIGLLVPQDSPDPIVRSQRYQYDRPAVHIAMLNDRKRTATYRAAIRESVTADSVVLDIGTGTGVLAASAALAGAKRVYAVEAGAVASVAQKLFDAAGVADRVTLVRGWSTDVGLPERANVMVSEMIGHDPFGERVLEITSDARERMLCKDAVLIPRRLALKADLVSVPEDIRERVVFTERLLGEWSRWYALPFEALARGTGGALAEGVQTRRKGIPLRRLQAEPAKARTWLACETGLTLLDVDLTGALPANPENRIQLTWPIERKFNALLTYFEAELTASQSLSSSPSLGGDACHWHPIAYIAETDICVSPGMTLEVRTEYRNGRTGVTVELG